MDENRRDSSGDDDGVSRGRSGRPGRRAGNSLGGDLAISGSASTVRWLLAQGLLDELNLLIHPIAVGHGQRLFEGTPTHRLTLLPSTALGSGVIHARYAPV